MSEDSWQDDKPPQSNTLIDSLIPSLPDILGVRDSIGAKKRDVYVLTRTWSGTQAGEGDYTDEVSQIKPTPNIVDYSHSIMLHEAGAVRSGDIIIKSLSKEAYPNESDVDLRVSQDSLNVEKFYFINNMEYTVIHVKDNYVTWDVQVRKRTDEHNKVTT